MNRITFFVPGEPKAQPREGLENPTCENLAVWIFRRVKPALTALVAVTVHESSTTTCRVTADDCTS
jgi:6-pyruvoyl-tetrahydropterin synthase